ncbi:MAG: glutamate--tRNA ligase [Acidobacteria bacterium]|nr:MAG: glutamate--tRNA ligase [Acidobacteriota bacterium]
MRFAPSPTGHLHVGNARTALFNWLFARQKGGTMVLRIEDTDVDRSGARFEDQLIDDMKWLGLDWDEGPDVGGSFGPYRQSDRLPIYREHAERLLSEHKAYLCFCTEAELQQDRERATTEHRQPIYSGKCRTVDPAEAQDRRVSGEACAIRLRIPEHPIRFHDIVHGAVEFSNEVVSDPIILRSSGMPVYNYVVVIDDALMKITHVIRGDDHLSNTPKQVTLYEALGWPVPEFAHLSTILGADRERLSKRHGATSIANFRDMGVLPEALVNYLALLGWAPSGGTREIFSRDELVKEFSLERVTPSPAVFDMEKLYWLNRHYIKERRAADWEQTILQPAIASSIEDLVYFLRTGGATSHNELVAQLNRHSNEIKMAVGTWGYFQRAGQLPEIRLVTKENLLWVSRMVYLLSPSVDRLEQLPERAALIFNYDAKAALASPDNAEVLGLPHTDAVLTRFTVKMFEDESASEGKLTAERFKQIVNEVKAETGAKGKELFHPIRIVITGSHSGPEFDKLIPILEEGSHLKLPKHVLSVRERVEEFAKTRGK